MKITKKLLPHLPKWIVRAHYLFERFLTNCFGINYTKLMHKRFNVELKHSSKGILKKNAIYVCGHTHHVEDDKRCRFINTGYFDFGDANYLIIGDSGNYKLYKDRY